MTLLEIVATVLTVACVLLANFRSTWQYPVGIVGTIAFFFVVYSAGLLANAGLQIFFLFVQLYGWWYWLKGDHGGKPPIRRVGYETYAYILLVGLIGAGAGYIFDQTITVVDAQVFALSVLAQFYLDRKYLETWIVWGAVNILSIYLYATAGLYALTALYVGLLINCVIAYRMWLKEYKLIKYWECAS